MLILRKGVESSAFVADVRWFNRKDMIIILANTPHFFIKYLAFRYPVRRWIYLGKDPSVAARVDATLCHRAKFIDYARTLYSLSTQKRRQFVDWMDAISATGRKQKEWFFSVPAVKNTASSNLFLYICYFFVLDDLIKKGQLVDLVVVDSPALAFLLRRQYFSSARFPVFNYLGVAAFFVRTFIICGYRYWRFFLDAFKKYVSARFVLAGRLKVLFPKGVSIVIVRNFIGPDFSWKDPGNFERHFFPGLGHYLGDRDKFMPAFLPIVLKCPSYRKLFAHICKSDKIVILAEEFLKLSDYVYAMGAWVRALWYKISTPLWEGLEFSGLVKEEYYSNLTEDMFLRANLLFRFGKRLKAEGIQPKGIINWNEYQAMEKGLISGLKESFPDLIVVGSRPFVYSPNHLSITPSLQDRLWGVIPHRTLVLGPIGREAVKEFLPDLPVDYSPAFRYEKLLDGRDRGTARRKNLMVLLGYTLPDAVFILKTLMGITEALELFERIYIRLHPATYFDENRLMRELRQSLPQQYVFAYGQMEDYLDQICIGVCGATGAAVNLIACGIPVIVIAGHYSLTMNYLSYKEDPQMWRLCFSSEEIIETVKEFYCGISHAPERFDEKAEEFRKAYFIKPDARYWQNYLISAN